MYSKITSFDLMETNQEKKQSFNAKCMFDLRLKTIPCFRFVRPYLLRNFDELVLYIVQDP